MITLWHGGSRWTTHPEIRAPKQGRYECGPGIYLSTSYSRARKYAAGGKVTTLVTLADNLTWLEDTKLPLSELLSYLDTAPRLRLRKELKEELRQRALHRGLGSNPCPVSYLVNLLINSEVLAGKSGVHLANWLAEKGIDTSLYHAMSGEEWVVVFNPKAIVSYKAIPAAEVLLTQYDMPRPSALLAATA